jgi:hypothetical protein
MRIGRARELREVSDVLIESEKSFEVRKVMVNEQDKRIMTAQDKMFESGTALLELCKKSNSADFCLDEADPHAKLSAPLLETFKSVQVWVEKEIIAHQAKPAVDPESLGAKNFITIDQGQIEKLNSLSVQCVRNLELLSKQNNIKLLNIKFAASEKEKNEQLEIATQRKINQEKERKELQLRLIEQDKQIEILHQAKLTRDSKAERIAIALAAESIKAEKVVSEVDTYVVDPLIAAKWEMVEQMIGGRGKEVNKKFKKANRKRK